MAVKEEFVHVPHLCESNIVLWEEISFLRTLGFYTEVFHPTVGQQQWSRTSQTNKDVMCWNAALRWRSWKFLTSDNEMLIIKAWRVISYKNTKFYSNPRAIHKPDASSHPRINYWLGFDSNLISYCTGSSSTHWWVLRSTTYLPTSFQIGGTGKNKSSVGFEKTNASGKGLSSLFFSNASKRKDPLKSLLFHWRDHSCSAGLFSSAQHVVLSLTTPLLVQGELGGWTLTWEITHSLQGRGILQCTAVSCKATTAAWREGLHSLCSRKATADHAMPCIYLLDPAYIFTSSRLICWGSSSFTSSFFAAFLPSFAAVLCFTFISRIHFKNTYLNK